MNQQRQNTQGILLMVGASLSFSIMAVAAKFCAKTLPVMEVVFLRSFLGALLIGLLLWRAGIGWRPKNTKIVMGRALIGFLALVLNFWAISQLDLGTAMLLNYTAPIFSVIFATIFMGEKPPKTVNVAILLSFAGIYLLASPQMESKPLPILAGLLSGFFLSLVHLLIRATDKEESPLTIIFYFNAVSSLGSLPLFYPSYFTVPEGWVWLGVAGLALGSFFGQLGLTNSLRCAPVSTVASFGYLTPVFSSFLGWFLWHDSLSGPALLGSALIILSGILIYKKQTRVAPVAAED